METFYWEQDLGELCAEAGRLRDHGKGKTITFSSKVFIPVTRLCSNACSYCGYRRIRSAASSPTFLAPQEVLQIAQAGERAGCTEALFVTGDRPEARNPGARRWLKRNHLDSTVEYVALLCRMVLEETTLIPHTNAGVLTPDELEALAPLNASMGLMLESSSARLGLPGGPHADSPTKAPGKRIEMLKAAGRRGIPFTTGILIGIGETADERTASIREIARIGKEYGHIQEVIIQNYRANRRSRMPDPPVVEHVRTVAVARLILGPQMNLQVPPNLARDQAPLAGFIRAGINDWGGISPVTEDLVNPGSRWPLLQELERETRAEGFDLRPRFPIYPEEVQNPRLAVSAPIRARIAERASNDGYVKTRLSAEEAR